jgi:hypothetical protein
MSHIWLTLETVFTGWCPLRHHSTLSTTLPKPFRTIYSTADAVPHLLRSCRYRSMPTTALPVPLRAIYITAGIVLQFPPPSVSIVSASDRRPHPVNPFGTRTYYPKGPRPWWLTQDTLQMIEERRWWRVEVTQRSEYLGKALIRLNKQPHDMTPSARSPCKTVYCCCHFFIFVCPFSPSLCISIYFPVMSPFFLCPSSHSLCTHRTRIVS